MINRFAQRIRTLSLACCLSLPLVSAEAEVVPTTVNYFFDRQTILKFSPAASSSERFGCGAPITPLVDMSQLFTFYEADKTQSVIDRVAMARYVKRTWAATAMMKRMGQFRDLYVRSAAQRPQIAKCILRNLRAWADANALLGGLEDNERRGHRQGVLVIIWQLYGMANAYALAAPDVEPSSEDLVPVLRWFNRLSDAIVAEFSPPIEPVEPIWRWLHATANHSNWAAVSVGAVGAITQDKGKLAFAMGELRRVLNGVSNDGSLPYEVARGAKGVQYQNLAMGAISLLVALADATEIRLTPSEEEELEKCATYTLNITFDPTPLEAASGRKQEPKLEALWWVEVILPHFRGRKASLAEEMDQRIAPFRPMEDKFLGGNVSFLFNPKASF